MADVTQLQPKKGRGKSPPTHLTIGEREELEAIRADKHLYWPHADGLGRGSKPVTPDTTGTEHFKLGHEGWGYHALKTGHFQFGTVTPDESKDAEQITRKNYAEKRDSPRGENTRENDADNVPPMFLRDYMRGYAAGFREGYESCKMNLLSILKESGAFEDE